MTERGLCPLDYEVQPAITEAIGYTGRRAAYVEDPSPIETVALEEVSIDVIVSYMAITHQRASLSTALHRSLCACSAGLLRSNATPLAPMHTKAVGGAHSTTDLTLPISWTIRELNFLCLRRDTEHPDTCSSSPS